MNQITPFLLIGLTLICIAMAAELWHTRVVDSRQMAYISERKISFLVEKFMLSARLESQIIQIHKSTSNLKETVAQAIFQVYKKAQEKDIYIDLQENENDEWMVLHDKNWIRGLWNRAVYYKRNSKKT